MEEGEEYRSDSHFIEVGNLQDCLMAGKQLHHLEGGVEYFVP